MKQINANELKGGEEIFPPRDAAFVSGRSDKICRVLDCQYCGFGVQRLVLQNPDGIFAVLVSCHWIVGVKHADRTG